MKLNPDQRNALSTIAARHPAPLIEVNLWVAAASLIRRGLVTKLPSFEPLSEQTENTVWNARRARMNRAEYRLTEAGKGECAIHGLRVGGAK